MTNSIKFPPFWHWDFRPIEGFDFAHGDGLTVTELKDAGKHFVCRYLSWLPNNKVINKTEFDMWIKAGVDVVLVWEFNGTEAQGGRAAGVKDATEAQRQAAALGVPEAILYFALDWDVQPDQYSKIAEYFDGVASVIRLERTGAYGGYGPISYLFNAGKITYGWQTYAWSFGKWDARAQIWQYHNGVYIAKCQGDLDRAMFLDFGQNPRPRPTPVKPKRKPGPQRHVADGTMSLDGHLAKEHLGMNSTLVTSSEKLSDRHLRDFVRYLAKGSSEVMDKGLVFWTVR